MSDVHGRSVRSVLQAMPPWTRPSLQMGTTIADAIPRARYVLRSISRGRSETRGIETISPVLRLSIDETNGLTSAAASVGETPGIVQLTCSTGRVFGPIVNRSHRSTPV